MVFNLSALLWKYFGIPLLEDSQGISNLKKEVTPSPKLYNAVIEEGKNGLADVNPKSIQSIGRQSMVDFFGGSFGESSNYKTS